MVRPVPSATVPEPVVPADSYCGAAPGHPFHGPYHDTEYGFPVADEASLFERLVLEINQAGLSWLTILKKRDGFRAAYHGFDVDAVAAYGPEDRARLLADAGIIRNRLKVEPPSPTRRGCGLRTRTAASTSGSPPTTRSTRGWEALQATFRFTGGEITGEFLMSTGWIEGAHHPPARSPRRRPRPALRPPDVSAGGSCSLA